MEKIINDIFSYISGTANYSGADIDRIGFWTFFLVLVTFFLWVVARKQLGGIRKTAKADFIRRFSHEVFNDITRDMFILFDYEALHFKTSEIKYGEDIPSKDYPYFLIDEKTVKQLKINPVSMKNILERKVYSAFEIDDYLLGYFEDIGSFEKQRLLDIEDVYNHFDWYIEKYWNNTEIQKYITQQREKENEGDDIYQNFEYIFKKCKSFEQSKNKKEPKFWWRLKRL